MQLLGPAGRLDHTQTFRTRTMDWSNPHWTCPACGRRVPDPNLYTHGSVPYASIETLAEISKMSLSVVTYGKPPRCCDVAARLIAVDYHAFHSERGADLVMRWRPDADAPEPMWWSADGYAPGPITHDEALCVIGDAFLRRAAVKLEVEGVDAAIDDIVLAQDEVPGDRELLALVPQLVEGGYLEMARTILDELLDSYPEDAEITALRASVDDDLA